MNETRPFARLRQFVRPRKPREQCALCAADLAAEHSHLLELSDRQLVCSCEACAILFSGQQGWRYRRVPRDVRLLTDFRMTEAQWDALFIPIDLAFFCEIGGRVVAMYPSPAGATESQLSLEAWDELKDENPILAELEPEVEALLVNRVGTARVYYRVPIDACYKLVGLIRTHWRGLSGGVDVWREIDGFFANLKAKAS